MTEATSSLAEAAEALVGSPFRLFGRDPRTGLDCVGLVICALRSAGIDDNGPYGYALRNLTIDHHLECVGSLGLKEVAGKIAEGDVLLFRLAAGQYHLGVVRADGALIHAHASLGRVVVTPGPPPWQVERHWRLSYP